MIALQLAMHGAYAAFRARKILTFTTVYALGRNEFVESTL